MVIKKEEALSVRQGVEDIEKMVDEAILNSRSVEAIIVKYEDDKGLPRVCFQLAIKDYQEAGWEAKFLNNLERGGRVLKAEIVLK